MKVESIKGWIVAVATFATLFTTIDQYLLGSMFLKRLNIPEQVPLLFYLITVFSLCLGMFLLSNRRLHPAYDDHTKTVEDLKKQLAAYANTPQQIAQLQGQITALEAAANEELVLEQRIHGLLSGWTRESELIEKLRIDASDTQAVIRLQTVLGKMKREKTIEDSSVGFRLTHSY